MFFKKLTSYDFENNIYARTMPVYIRFYSIFNKKFRNNISKLEYICDEDFLKYLEDNNFCIVPTVKTKVWNLAICIEKLPNEIQDYLRINDDVCLAFKLYLNDKDLDKLYKGIKS